MSQFSASKNVADRRRFLTFAVAAAAIVPISESAFARDKHHGNEGESSRLWHTEECSESERRFKLQTALRDLWLGHIFWVRNVSVAAIDKNESAVKAAEQQAVANAKAIAASIEPFYGAAAKEGFFKLLAGHYGAVKAYLVATVAGDAAASSDGHPGSYFKCRRDRGFPEQSQSVSAERRGARSSPGSRRSSHPANPATEGSEIRSRGANLGRDEAARLSDRRRDG